MRACTGSDAFTGGPDSQPARASTASVQAAIDDNGAMGWVFLEIIVALAIAVAIVWWTIPKQAKRDDETGER
jgi:hypothetical protein